MALHMCAHACWRFLNVLQRRCLNFLLLNSSRALLTYLTLCFMWVMNASKVDTLAAGIKHLLKLLGMRDNPVGQLVPLLKLWCGTT